MSTATASLRRHTLFSCFDRVHSSWKTTRERLHLVGPAILVLLAASHAEASTWVELGDAGDIPGSAQVTAGIGPLATIQGTFLGATDVDMYCIQINEEAFFGAYILCAMVEDPDLWLFDSAGNGVALHDNCQNGVVQLTSALATSNGTYYLAISPSESEAMNGLNLPIWDPPTSLAERAPDGAGAPGPLSHWGGTDPIAIGPSYAISLGGATFCESPVPAKSMTWGGLKSRYR